MTTATHIRHLLATICLCCLLAVLALHCGGKEAPAGDAKPAATASSAADLQLTAAQRSALQLAFAAAETREIAGTITVPANVAADPNQTAAVTCLLPGRISAVLARQGAAVRRGQEMARVESIEYGALVAEVLETHADRIAARAEHERVSRLREENVSSQRQFEQAEAALASAEARAAGARKKLLAAGVTPDEADRLIAKPDDFPATLALRAPIGGVVSARHAAIGQQVGAGETLFELLDAGSVVVEGHVFEDDFARVRRGQHVRFTTHATGASVYTGAIETVGAVIEEQTHTLLLRCRIANPGGHLRPNLHGSLDVMTSIPVRVLAVSTDAIVYDGDKRFVFVAVADDAFQYRVVTTGREFDGWTEIASGLREGERVVTAGVFQLKSQLKLSQAGGGE